MLGGGDRKGGGGVGWAGGKGVRGVSINRVGVLAAKGPATFLFCLIGRTEILTGNTQSVDHRLHPMSVPLHFTRIPLSIMGLVHVA